MSPTTGRCSRGSVRVENSTADRTIAMQNFEAVSCRQRGAWAWQLATDETVRRVSIAMISSYLSLALGSSATAEIASDLRFDMLPSVDVTLANIEIGHYHSDASAFPGPDAYHASQGRRASHIARLRHNGHWARWKPKGIRPNVFPASPRAAVLQIDLPANPADV